MEFSQWSLNILRSHCKAQWFGIARNFFVMVWCREPGGSQESEGPGRKFKDVRTVQIDYYYISYITTMGYWNYRSQRNFKCISFILISGRGIFRYPPPKYAPGRASDFICVYIILKGQFFNNFSAPLMKLESRRNGILKILYNASVDLMNFCKLSSTLNS